jgi:hypothetical protein
MSQFLKSIFILIIILALMGLIAAGFYALVQARAFPFIPTSGGGRFERGSEGDSEILPFLENSHQEEQPFQGRGAGRRRGEHEEISVTSGLAGILRSLLLIAGCTLGVVAVQSGVGFVKRLTHRTPLT